MLKIWFQKNSIASNKGSIAYRFRKKRMHEFEKFYEKKILNNDEDKKKTILDVGGTLSFWLSMDFKYIDKVTITLLNLKETEIPDSYENIFSVAGDATNLSQYKDKEFDLVFSNSVIEHVGSFKNQRNMAEEMVRVGKHYYLQTPNKFFFLEPHFLIPFFQFFPLKLKAFLIRNYQLGNMRQAKNELDALQQADSIRLLTKNELCLLFPMATITRERFLFMTKSYWLSF